MARKEQSKAEGDRWQNRVRGRTAWNRDLAKQIDALFNDLPEKPKERFKVINQTRTTFREKLAKETANCIAESFKDTFDEKGRMQESPAKAKSHAAMVREWLNACGFALVNPKNGKPCQLFVEMNNTREQYVLSPVGKRDWSNERKLSVVAQALSQPQLIDRPKYVRSFGHEP